MSNMQRGILNLEEHVGKQVRVQFQGGREVVGVLQGYDAMVNVVLEDATEYLRSKEDPYQPSGETRQLGRVVCRGNNVTLVFPEEGHEQISNPFTNQDEMVLETKS